MTPTEADMARAAGYGNWVDRVEELEAKNADLFRTIDDLTEAIEGTPEGDLVRRVKELEAENARLRKAEEDYDADTEEELMRRADRDELAAQLAAVHSRLDAMGVPACETEKCLACAGSGKDYDTECQSVDSWPCDGCNGKGQRPVACRITARLDWFQATMAVNVLAEREACAKLAESTCVNEKSPCGSWQSGPKGDVIARLIRARAK